MQICKKAGTEGGKAARKRPCDKIYNNKLIALLDGLEVKKLNEKYGERNITDLPTSHLRINFADGTSKHVEDYGKRGTEKLEELYKFFEDLRFSQQWTKVN